MAEEKTATAMMTEQDYRKADAMNYSRLCKLVDGPKAFKDPEEMKGDYLDNGSAVDVLLTEGEDAFHKQFYVMTESKPSSDMMLKYVEALLESGGDHAVALQASGYKSNPNAPTKSNPDGPTKFDREGKPYYESVLAAKGRIVLDFEQYQMINTTVNQLRNNPYTCNFFKKHDPKQLEILNQFIYFWDFKYMHEESGEMRTRKFKMKADFLILDHVNKVIYGKDLKTTGKPTGYFLSGYRSFRYYLQEGIYQEGIMNFRDHNYPDYDVKPFEFIVAQMGGLTEPLIYKVSTEQHAKNVYGGKTSTGFEIKGVAQLLCDLDYHEQEDQWEYKKEVADNNGRINIELFE